MRHQRAYRYATALAQSSLLPKDLAAKPANVLAIILYGQQLDLTPMQAIQSIYVVNGRPSMSGQLWLSKVREAGHVAYIPCAECGQMPGGDIHKPTTGHRYVADHDEKHCTFMIFRRDTEEEHTETFTWAQAEKAGLTRKDVWKSFPKRMLMWRAVSNCATVICPEVALGFGVEEPGEVGPARPSLAQVAAERTDQQIDTRAHEDAPEDAVVVEPDPAVDEQERAMLAELDAEHTTEHTTAPAPDLFADGA